MISALSYNICPSQGTAPTIAIDNTNGCQLYLSKDSLNSSITTAKSSEVNVAVPGATPEDDLVQQFNMSSYRSTFLILVFTTKEATRLAIVANFLAGKSQN
jgi:hypothetical protein